MRIGLGFDSHRLAPGQRLVLGGVDIPFEMGLLGHSDADVLCHAIIDGIIGALGKGDIGRHFPDTDNQWKNASSIDLLSRTTAMMREEGYEVIWIDANIIAEQPKLQDRMEDMKHAISAAGIPRNRINIKAKTSEGMGTIGKGEGMAAQAVCLLGKVDSD